MTQSGDKKAPDWERIELDYRAGVLSVREIAASQGVSHTAINSKSKKNGWVRDLSAKIKAKADSLVSSAEVSKQVSIINAVNERVVVEANAQAIANVRLSHRSDIARFKKLSIKLLDELEHQTDNQDLYQELGEFLRSEDDKGVDKRNDLYSRVIELPSRIDSSKKLADTLKILIGLEREAYGLSVEGTHTDTIPAGLGHMYGRT